MKILHVIRSLGSGGAERQIVDLVENLSSDGISHVVCHLMEPDFFAESIRIAGGRTICLGLKGKRPWFSAAKKLRKVIRDERPDIVHTWLADATIATRLACYTLKSPPRIVSLCGPDYEPEVIRMARYPAAKIGVLRSVDKWTGRLAREEFVAVSDYIRQSARDQLKIPAERIRTIYNSVDPNTLSGTASPSEIRRRLGIPENAVVFMNVGRLDTQKGQAYLLQALKKIESAAPQAFVALIGEGGLEPHLREIVSVLSLESKVRFLGVRNDVGECLRAADVFVFPSIFEGFGMALVEAMYVGLPVVASRTGPIPEILDDKELGWLVEPRSVEELAQAMFTLYEDPDLRIKFGAKGRDSALKRFSSLEAVIPQWKKLYLSYAQY